jgi:DNA invertase Pin-like site-specific DNA recombinase
MINRHKITMERLKRQAVVYLRQSSDHQVKCNKESQTMQYAMADQAKELGFVNVEVIDDDLGFSAGFAAKRRKGFERLLAKVALGEVGLILCREVSRLSRTDKDWCQLLEVCQIFDTLVGDAESIYDVNSLDDQLVLGIKGTLSVVELRVLKMRMLAGRENKAKRGQLYPMVAPGYVIDADGQCVKDPNMRIQEAISLVFSKFREIWSLRQTYKWFLDNDVELPVNKFLAGKKQIVFQRPTQTFIGSILHNPFYAGAYFYGRRTTVVAWEEHTLKKRTGRVLKPGEMRVFIRDHHEGYIDWADFEENQRMIAQNNVSHGNDAAKGSVRAGRALLCGLLRCGHCGRKVYVRYVNTKGGAIRYLCSGDFALGGSYCLGFGGATTDRRFAEEIVRFISPLSLRASLQALDQLAQEENAHLNALARQVQQVEYETSRAFEQFNEVDPKNRLVAAELERRWNSKLQALERAKEKMRTLDNQRTPASEEMKQQILMLGQDFASVWNHAQCPNELKKKIIRTLVHEVIVKEEPVGKLHFVIHWQGGSHTGFAMDKPCPHTINKTGPENIEVISKMAVRYGDSDIARVLNKLGRRTGTGKPWSEMRVATVRRKNGIAGFRKTPTMPGILTLKQAETYSGASDTSIKRLVDAGILPMTQIVPYAPWEIKKEDLDAQPVQKILERLKRTGKLVLDGDAPMSQQELYLGNIRS